MKPHRLPIEGPGSATEWTMSGPGAGPRGSDERRARRNRGGGLGRLVLIVAWLPRYDRKMLYDE